MDTNFEMVQRQKQLAKKRRERKFHTRLMTLSWSLPVIAFGSFFTVWHEISSALNKSTSQSAKSVTSKPAAVATTNPVLLKIGSRGTQVSTIQEQLSQLGYFNHAVTQYYGDVTAEAVRLFQSAQGIPATGSIDDATLQALQIAVRQNSVNDLTQGTSSDSTGSSNTVQSSPSVALSQQSNPVAVSSGS